MIFVVKYDLFRLSFEYQLFVMLYSYYHLHSIVTPRREMKVVSSFPTHVIIGQLYVLHFKLLIRGRERLQPFLQLYPANRYK